MEDGLTLGELDRRIDERATQRFDASLNERMAEIVAAVQKEMGDIDRTFEDLTDRITGIVREMMGDEIADLMKDERERAMANQIQMSEGSDPYSLEERAKRMRLSLFRGDHRLGGQMDKRAGRAVTGWERVETFDRNRQHAAENQMRGFGQGHHFATLVQIAGRQFLEKGSFADALEGYMTPEKGRTIDQETCDYLERVLQSGDFAGGGALIPEVFSTDFIPALYAAAIVLRSGVMVVSMPNGNLTIAKQFGTADAFSIGENDEITASEPNFGEIKLTAKKIAVFVPISNDMLRHGDASVSGIIQNDMIRIAALRRDLLYLRGSGVGNEPEGLLNQTAAANVVTSQGTQAQADIVTDAIAAKFRVHNSDVEVVRPAWYMAVREEFGLMQVLTADGMFAFPEVREGRWMGAPLWSTTQIPTNLDTSLTGGNDESDIHYVETTQVVVGETVNQELRFSEHATFDDGSGQVNGFQADISLARLITESDIKARHPEALAVIRETIYGNNL